MPTQLHILLTHSNKFTHHILLKKITKATIFCRERERDVFINCFCIKSNYSLCGTKSQNQNSSPSSSFCLLPIYHIHLHPHALTYTHTNTSFHPQGHNVVVWFHPRLYVLSLHSNKRHHLSHVFMNTRILTKSNHEAWHIYRVIWRTSQRF